MFRVYGSRDMNHTGAFIISIEFWGVLYYNQKQERQKASIVFRPLYWTLDFVKGPSPYTLNSRILNNSTQNPQILNPIAAMFGACLLSRSPRTWR